MKTLQEKMEALQNNFSNLYEQGKIIGIGHDHVQVSSKYFRELLDENFGRVTSLDVSYNGIREMVIDDINYVAISY